MQRSFLTTFGVTAALTGTLAAVAAVLAATVGAGPAQAATQDLLPPVTVTWTPKPR